MATCYPTEEDRVNINNQPSPPPLLDQSGNPIEDLNETVLYRQTSDWPDNVYQSDNSANRSGGYTPINQDMAGNLLEQFNQQETLSSKQL